MGSKMLIDAAHPEETRVVVLKNGRIEEFEYESADRKQLKSNIYLAKVTRVEPSLQAAFVDYGGNRHGFLAFSEIHPDYYQIPVADREALLQEEEETAVSDSEIDQDDESLAEERDKGGETATASDDDDDTDGDGDSIENGEDDTVDDVGAGDAMEEVPVRRRRPRRNYQIQEVIRRRQVILVQVVKEERGNKGAALTTYLSLAGRYCVLMPNTARGGGISRKITDAADRRRLKEVAKSLTVPEGMGLIVRTAGAQRTKPEIRRDFEYLLRLWESVRELTLNSTAPSLVYEEGSLIKRAIRDLYTKDVDEVIVEGEAGYHEAKSFMKMLMPSHARNVKAHKDTRPLFSAAKVDAQLDSLFSPVVTLKSGGYLVIDQTEALVSIDINSGKSTREHNIEDTALRTNLEAAEEISRQLRLRDLAGLIVIDFIDMEEKRNNRAVERRMKEVLKNDRARIQVGRISHFGLMEMSRQRLRQGMLENTTTPCPACQGTGVIRSLASTALSVLRQIEEQLTASKTRGLNVLCHPDVATYILNQKRDHLLFLESTYAVSIYVEARVGLGQAEVAFERSTRSAATSAAKGETAGGVSLETAYEEGERADGAGTDKDEAEREASEDGGRKRRRRRGRRGGRKNRAREERGDESLASEASDEQGEPAEPADAADGTAVEATTGPAAEIADVAGEVDEKPKARKRARKPRKKAVAKVVEEQPAAAEETVAVASDDEAAATQSTDEADADGVKTKAKPARKPRKAAAKKSTQKTAAKPRKTAARKKAAKTDKPAAGDNGGEPAPTASRPDEPVATPAEAGRSSPPDGESWSPPQPAEEEPAGPPRSGWWSRR